MDKLTLEYMCSRGLSVIEASVLIEAISSCAIENPKCAEDETIEDAIKYVLKEVDDGKS